jgi:hypothetical protein
VNETTEKLNSLAAALGGTFEGGEREGAGIVSGAITLADGVQFWVNVGGYGNEGRIRCSCRYPQHETRDGYLHSTIQRDFDSAARYGSGALFQPITASFDKPVDRLAAEIERRYLTRYRTLYAEAVEWCEKQRLYFYNKRITVGTVEQAMGKFKYSLADRGFYANILHVNDTTADIGLYGLTVDQVLALEKFLSEL